MTCSRWHDNGHAWAKFDGFPFVEKCPHALNDVEYLIVMIMQMIGDAGARLHSHQHSHQVIADKEWAGLDGVTIWGFIIS